MSTVWTKRGWIQVMQNILHKAHRWCKAEVGNFHTQKQKIMMLIDQAQGQKDFKTLQNLHLQLDEVLQHEEFFWHQRSKVNWLHYGDRNTKFFHQKATRRKCTNLINSLQNDEGFWTTNDNELGQLLFNYFLNLFTASQINLSTIYSTRFTPLTRASYSILSAPFTVQEIQDAVNKMDPWKAPGPDGIPLGVYKDN